MMICPSQCLSCSGTCIGGLYLAGDSPYLAPRWSKQSVCSQWVVVCFCNTVVNRGSGREAEIASTQSPALSCGGLRYSCASHEPVVD